MKRRVSVLAMGVLGVLVSAGVGAGQAPPTPVPAPAAPQEPAEPDAETLPANEPAAFEEDLVGPTEGAPTVSLERAVALALEGNFALLNTADSVTGSRYREDTAEASFYPKLTPRYRRSTEGASSVELDAGQRLPWSGGALLAAGTYTTTPTDATAPSDSSQLRLVLNQPLLRGFGPTVTYFELKNARRARQDSERNFEIARQRLAINVATAFFQVIRQRQLLGVSRQSLRRSQSLREASQARMKVGLASKLDVLRADLQAAQAQDAMLAAEFNLRAALERFRIRLGQPPHAALEPEAVTLDEQVSLELEPLEVLLLRARESRLELAESRDQVDDAARSAAVARQNLLPQLDLNLGFTQSGSGIGFTDSFRRPLRSWDVFFSTSYPLERTGDRAQKAIAEINLESRRRALREAEYEVEAEVRTAVRELERIEKSLDLQRQSVAVAEQQHRLATLRYQRGLASNFDVVDAEGSLRAARTAFVSLLADFQVARIELLRATGTLDVAQEFSP